LSLCTIDFRRLHLEAGQRLLDVGCGEGRHTLSAWLEAPVHAIGLDRNATDLATARSRARDFAATDDTATDDGYPSASARLAWIEGDAMRLPFPDATFERVICAEVLEHVPDYRAVLAEIRRVLKPGGLLAVSVPRFLPEWICWRLSDAYHEVPGGHIRIFRSGALRASVESHGFRCLRRHWAHALHVPYWWLRCLFWSRGPEYWPVRQYHRLLVWDLMQRPRLTRWLERALNPLLGKSVVMYFVRDHDPHAATITPTGAPAPAGAQAPGR
jgi:SAM-dependent methyltransferase